jgi:replication factor C subunit 3/5
MATSTTITATNATINKSTPWVEKYRPTNFNDIVLDPLNKLMMRNIIATGHFPNLLFYGPPGTGKTTTIINLVNEYQQARMKCVNSGLMIHLNASDERGIDIIRVQINSFVTTKSLFGNGTKFVILDEVDYMTKPAQQAFKYLLQSFSSNTVRNVRFCLICNYLSKIDESLRHEFMTIRFNQLPQRQIHAFIHSIAEKEGIKMGWAEIETIQQIYKSDIRSMINFIQMNQDMVMIKKNILTDAVWETFHTMGFAGLSSGSGGEERERKMKCKLQEMSIQYNMDKKHLLKRYFHFLVKKGYGMTTWNLEVIRNIVHYTESTAEQQLVYFLHHFVV